MNKMRTMAMSTALTLMAVAAIAAPLGPIQVGTPAINCVFNPNCTNVVEESSSPFTLPGTVGTGLLHTRVILGESNSPAAGLFGYEYRLDLGGVTLDPAVPPCVTNVVKCVTNRMRVSLTNVVVCRTNVVGASNVLNCVTNTIPGTNLVFCVTNSFPETNIVQCPITAGVMVCFTNSFPATNYVLCFTNRVPARTVVTCQTNRLTGRNVVTCTTNNVRYVTNIVTCTTNTVPCPGSTPCIQTLRINFGPAVSGLAFDTNGPSRAQFYVVSTGGLGSNAPTESTLVDGKLTLSFSPPLCPGDSSLSVGLVSRGAPRDVPAKLKLSIGGNVLTLARAPQVVRRIDCDFRELAEAIRDLKSRDILAPNNTARESRRAALLDLVREAHGAAEAGNAENVMAALAAILDKTDGGRNDWLASGAARKVNKLMADISKCIGDDEDVDRAKKQNHHVDDDDDDHGRGR